MTTSYSSGDTSANYNYMYYRQQESLAAANSNPDAGRINPVNRERSEGMTRTTHGVEPEEVRSVEGYLSDVRADAVRGERTAERCGAAGKPKCFVSLMSRNEAEEAVSGKRGITSQEAAVRSDIALASYCEARRHFGEAMQDVEIAVSESGDADGQVIPKKYNVAVNVTSAGETYRFYARNVDQNELRKVPEKLDLPGGRISHDAEKNGYEVLRMERSGNAWQVQLSKSGSGEAVDVNIDVPPEEAPAAAKAAMRTADSAIAVGRESGDPVRRLAISVSKTQQGYEISVRGASVSGKDIEFTLNMRSLSEDSPIEEAVAKAMGDKESGGASQKAAGAALAPKMTNAEDKKRYSQDPSSWQVIKSLVDIKNDQNKNILLALEGTPEEQEAQKKANEARVKKEKLFKEQLKNESDDTELFRAMLDRSALKRAISLPQEGLSEQDKFLAELEKSDAESRIGAAARTG